MARTVVSLNDTKIKGLKPKSNAYTVSDGDGLHLLVKPNGTKLWEFRYKSPTLLKRRKTSFGNYPSVTLKQARDKKNEFKALIIDGIDPIDHIKQLNEEKKEQERKELYSIANLVEEYYDFRKDDLSASTIKKDRSRIYFSFIDRLKNGADTNLYTLDFATIKNTLQYLEDTNKLETLKKVKGIIIRLLKFAFSRDIADTSSIIAKLELYSFKKQSKKDVKNNPTLLAPEDIKRLYNDILNYKNNIITRYLLIFSIHTGQRQGSIIQAKWDDIDFKKKIWTIPAEQIKMRKEHVIPLSDIILKYLEELKPYTNHLDYIFPNSQTKSSRNKYPHISNNTVTRALRIMGYTKEEQTAHGFRAMFKTLCKEHQETHNLNNEFVERYLAHKVDGDVESAYNRAKNIEDMRKIANWWSAYLEKKLDINDTVAQ